MATDSEHILFIAIWCNSAEAVQQALRKNGDNLLQQLVNCAREYTNTTPLMEACRFGHDEIVRILLESGADPWRKDKMGGSAIWNACVEGHLSTVEMLLNHDHGLLEIVNNHGLTPLFAALNGDQIEIVRFLVNRGANVGVSGGNSRWTALMHASYKGNLAMVRLLLGAGANVEARDENQKNALHCAADFNRIDVVRELVLEHDANMFAVDIDGDTPFDMASQPPLTFSARFLIESYGRKLAQDHGRFALHAFLRAAGYSYVENDAFHPPLKPLLKIHSPLGSLSLEHLRILLQHFDTELIRNRDDSGKLPIRISCQTNAPVEVLSALVELDSATLQIADDTGALTIHVCSYGVVDDASVRLLVERGGVGTLAARTREGALPLHNFCGSTNPSLRTVQYLIQSFPGSVAAPTNAGQYPFMIAAGKTASASLSVVYELCRASPNLLVPRI